MKIKIMKVKNGVFLFMALIGIWGFITTLSIFYLVMGIVFSLLSWPFVAEFVTGKPPKKWRETQSEYEKRLEQRAIEIAEQQKWTTVLKKILEINPTDNRVKLCGRAYDFKDIISCDLINESAEQIVTQTTGVNRRKVSLGKALIGVAVFGPTGAIIGGLAGKTKVNQKSVTTSSPICSKLQIIVTVTDFKSPVVHLNFINSNVYKNSNEYNKAFESATKVMATIQGIINKNNNYI